MSDRQHVGRRVISLGQSLEAIQPRTGRIESAVALMPKFIGRRPTPNDNSARSYHNGTLERDLYNQAEEGVSTVPNHILARRGRRR